MKINDSFSSWSEILYGVPQRLILGPLLFNTFIRDIFYVIVNFEIENYADELTPFSAKLDGRSVELEISSSILFTWLYEGKYIKQSCSVIW